ncbi:hypothetical protein ACFFU1_06085 [Algibacter miyuki]|uniref:Uncharacterized protein n=1 Tax=Algibacter miyuki TaxID=1306933 RepID=A0ABV5GXU4_9FLAO|nr:hypothetical protein [Algibacter miyuki]MDN3667450.1 hypothetical protein [Algibacter miyuki]
MKKLTKRIIPILILVLGICLHSRAQNVEIKGIVLNKEATKYFQSAGYKFIKVANDGITTAFNGYKMFYNKKDESVLISKHQTKPPGKTQILLGGSADFFCTKGCEEEGCVIERIGKRKGYNKNAITYECVGCYKNDGGVELCEGSLVIRKVILKDILKQLKKAK